MNYRKAVVLLTLLQVLVLIVLGAAGCGAKVQGGNGNGSEDRPLSPMEGRRGSESILFTRNDNPEIGTSENDRYFIIDKPGDSPTKIDKERMLFPVKAPDGNSLAYLPMKSGFRELALYEIDTGSERVFQVVDTIEEVFGVSLGDITSFSWAPDGRSVYVCINPAPDARGNITLPVRLFRFYLEDSSCRELSLDGGAESYLGSIAVSPSGTRIILNQFWCGDLYEQSVRNIRKIISEPTEANGQIYPYTSPIWLNDSVIIYIEGSGMPRLVKLDIDAGLKTILLESTPEMVLGWAPRAVGIPLACSPEGDRILFPVLTDPVKYAESEDCISPLYIINMDGTGLLQATDPEKNGAAWGDTWPCWASK